MRTGKVLGSDAVVPVKDVDPYRKCCKREIQKIVRFLKSTLVPGVDLLAAMIEKGNY